MSISIPVSLDSLLFIERKSFFALRLPGRVNWKRDAVFAEVEMAMGSDQL
jgi:hypothetical protein